MQQQDSIAHRMLGFMTWRNKKDDVNTPWGLIVYIWLVTKYIVRFYMRDNTVNPINVVVDMGG